MSARIACVYGISPRVPGIKEGDCFSVYRSETTVLGFTGKGCTVFWFAFEDLGHAHPLSSCPRYSEEDIETTCQAVAHLQLSPSLKFGDVYARRSFAIKIPLEEGTTRSWHTSRTVLVGDAAHKVCLDRGV